MIKAVIFDVDGVIVDSFNANTYLYQQVLQKGGYPVPTKEQVRPYFHTPFKETLAALGNIDDEMEVQRLVDMLSEPDIRDHDLLEFPKKLESVLEELHEAYRLGIVTSRSQRGLEDIFSLREIKHLFEVTMAYEDSQNHKPHPEPLILALRFMKLAPHEAVYVGDGLTDIDAALAAGMKSIHLSVEPHDEASAVINAFEEVIEAVAALDK